MKIFFPVIFYLPKVVGGIELYIHHLALGLQQNGHEIKVVVPSYSEDDSDNYSYQGIEVIRYKAYHPKGRLEFAGIEANELQYCSAMAMHYFVCNTSLQFVCHILCLTGPT